MKSWTDLILAFGCGFALGLALASFHFRSTLRMYKEYIEHRLAAINRFRPPNGPSWRLSKFSFWKAAAGRRSKPDKDPN